MIERAVIFEKSRFPEFFSLMKEFGTVYAPVRVSKQSFSFKEVNDSCEIAFDALRTILPPKKFFFPQRETILSYSSGNIVTEQPQIEAKTIFGVHPCDLAGLGIMDDIYMSEPVDPHYANRRKNTLLVGLSCWPDKHCFCKSMGTESPTNHYDLFLTDLDSHYMVQINTPSGLEQIEKFDSLFESPNEDLKQKFKDFWSDRSNAFESSFESDNLPAIVDMEWNSSMWDDLGNRCLSCGNCIPVCPTCYCFDMIDMASLKEDEGSRVREWDGCQFVGFASVAGDFNFRPGPVDRLKFWYRHKLHGFEDAHGYPTCVGCGRCTVSCPSGIDDIVNVVLRMQGKPSILITDNENTNSREA